MPYGRCSSKGTEIKTNVQLAEIYAVASVTAICLPLEGSKAREVRQCATMASDKVNKKRGREEGFRRESSLARDGGRGVSSYR